MRSSRRDQPRVGRTSAEEGLAEADDDRLEALGLVPLSPAIEARLACFADLLIRWQHVKNLVAPSTLTRIWTRHIADSAQIVDFFPQARRWADMGSGAGFPGIVVAILLQDRPGAEIHLVESNGRKCAFLREAARACGAPARIHCGRVEEIFPKLEPVDVVTARALAPLPRLLEMGKSMFERGAGGVFLKSAAEVDTLAQAGEPILWSVHPSKTSPQGRIVTVQATTPGG